MSGFRDDLSLIIEVHNDVRETLYPAPCPKAHIQNENTLVRLAALLEAYGWDTRRESKRLRAAIESGQMPVTTSTSGGEVAAMALTYLRNLVVHRDHGLYTQCAQSPWWPGFQEFLRRHPQADGFSVGEPIYLAGDAVIQPLVEGMVRWARDRGLD